MAFAIRKVLIILIVSLLNHCRYTNEQIYKEVQEQLAENPFLKPLVESLLPELEKKAKKNPNAKFCFSHWGKTKEIAQKELKELQWSKLDALTRVLFYRYYKQEIAAGEITVSAFFSTPVQPFSKTIRETPNGFRAR